MIMHSLIGFIYYSIISTAILAVFSDAPPSPSISITFFSFIFISDLLIGSSSIIDMGLVQNFLDILLKPLKKKMAFSELEIAKAN